jgi:hypothetical protein
VSTVVVPLLSSGLTVVSSVVEVVVPGVVVEVEGSPVEPSLVVPSSVAVPSEPPSPTHAARPDVSRRASAGRKELMDAMDAMDAMEAWFMTKDDMRPPSCFVPWIVVSTIIHVMNLGGVDLDLLVVPRREQEPPLRWLRHMVRTSVERRGWE